MLLLLAESSHTQEDSVVPALSYVLPISFMQADSHVPPFLISARRPAFPRFDVSSLTCCFLIVLSSCCSPGIDRTIEMPFADSACYFLLPHLFLPLLLVPPCHSLPDKEKKGVACPFYRSMSAPLVHELAHEFSRPKVGLVGGDDGEVDAKSGVVSCSVIGSPVLVAQDSFPHDDEGAGVELAHTTNQVFSADTKHPHHLVLILLPSRLFRRPIRPPLSRPNNSQEPTPSRTSEISAQIRRGSLTRRRQSESISMGAAVLELVLGAAVEIAQAVIAAAASTTPRTPTASTAKVELLRPQPLVVLVLRALRRGTSNYRTTLTRMPSRMRPWPVRREMPRRRGWLL